MAGDDDDALVRALVAIDGAIGDGPTDATAAARLDYLVEVLVARGHLTAGHRRLFQHVRAGGGTTVEISAFENKHEVGGPDIDCASLLHLCFARCCSFRVTLSRTDVREGKLAWDFDRPYTLPRNPNGYCSNLDDDARCKVYEERPGDCRNFDCRTDPRVWIDFEQRIPAPMPERVIPLDRLRRRGP